MTGRTSLGTKPSKQQIDELLALHRRGEFKSAMAGARVLAKRFPREAFLPYFMGRMNLALGLPKEAEPLFRNAIALKSDMADAHNDLGNALRALGRRDEAIASFGKAISLRPGFAGAYSNLGDAQTEAGRIDEAIANCAKATELDPNSPEAHNNLGAAYSARKEFAKAWGCYRRALEINPRSSKANCNLISSLVEAGQPRNAFFYGQNALVAMSNDANLLFATGHAAKSANLTRTAVSLFDRALQIRPDDPVTLVAKAHVLLLEEEFEAARPVAQRALFLSPDMALAHLTLATVEAKLGQTAEADRHFAEAARIDPSLVKVDLERGNIFFESGMMREAERVFNDVLAREPANLEARSYLARLRTATPEDENFLALARAAESVHDVPESSRVLLHFALGKCLDDLKRYDEAFAQFVIGNRLKSERMVFDVESQLSRFERFRRSVDIGLIRDLAGFGHDSALPIFILGMPRSGTTLVEAILDSHPDVVGAGELRNFTNILSACGLDFAKQRENSGLALTGELVALIGKTYVESLAARFAGVRHVVDKMPWNFLTIGLIHLALPNARIVHTKRDPVDTCLSNFMQNFAAGNRLSYDLRHIGRCYRHYLALMDYWRSILPAGALHEIQYENLVENPESETRDLLAYCRLDWHEGCLNFHARDRVVRTSSVSQVRTPLYKSSVRKWRNYEKHLGPLFEELGMTDG